jgi:nitroimidazol reductase NimA-like FMN-containing flavoprotein (pyridoxamine 5'-phosphate oxidase superfamily)
MVTAVPDPRTGLVELPEEECWELLESTSFGRVAVNAGTTPDIFPVHYRVHDGEILVRTEAGTKLAAATLLGPVAFEIDAHDDDTRTGWSVVAKGHGREPKRLEEIVAFDDLGIEPWVDTPKTRWLAIRPHEVTGRRIP